MNSVDPKRTALQFNEYINQQDLNGLTGLMTEAHTFIDRKGDTVKGRDAMRKGWADFFKAFPEYRNTFEKVESQGNVVVMYGYAMWNRNADPDYAIWTATVEDNLISEWRIHENSDENRKRFNIA